MTRANLSSFLDELIKVADLGSFTRPQLPAIQAKIDAKLAPFKPPPPPMKLGPPANPPPPAQPAMTADQKIQKLKTDFQAKHKGMPREPIQIKMPRATFGVRG